MLTGIMDQLALGQITWLSGAVLCLVAVALGAIGGALGGMLVGGKHIGYGVSAMMGTFFGPIAALPGILLALVALLLI
jgi:hypothetical protein